MQIRHAVEEERRVSQEVFGDFASMHEAYGVLAEEVDELFQAVKLKQQVPERSRMIAKEAIQIAAVALRIAEQAKLVLR